MIRPRKLPSGKWQARFTDANGNSKSAGTFDTRKEAQEAIISSQHAVLSGTYDDGTRGSELFSVWAPKAIELADIGTNTAYNYQGILRRELLPFFGDRRLRDIHSDDVALWWKRSASKSSRQTYLNVLKKIFSMAVASSDPLVHLEFSPCRVKTSSSYKGRELLDLDELWSIYDAASPTMKNFIMLTFAISGRVGEVIGLDWGKVNMKTAKVVIDQQYGWVAGQGYCITPPKNGHSRTVDVFEQGMEVLRSLPQGIGATPVLQSVRGHRADRRSLYREWSRLRLMIGRPDAHIHDLRHLSATVWANYGANLQESMDRLGHSTVTMAVHYQHASQSRMSELAKRVSEATTRDAV